MATKTEHIILELVLINTEQQLVILQFFQGKKEVTWEVMEGTASTAAEPAEALKSSTPKHLFAERCSDQSASFKENKAVWAGFSYTSRLQWLPPVQCPLNQNWTTFCVGNDYVSGYFQWLLVE